MLDLAERTVTQLIPRPKTVVARAGLAYERKFIVKLREVVNYKSGCTIEHNPAFRYRHREDSCDKICVPDALLLDAECEFGVVIEVKQTFVPGAIEKLRTLYCPVVSKAIQLPCVPLVVCRHLTPGAPNPSSRISFALSTKYPLYQWLGTGPILY